MLVPRGPDLFGTLDEVLGHRRRYTEATLRRAALDAGLEPKELLPFNRVGTPAWWLNGKLLRRRHFGFMQIVVLNLLTPLFRLDRPGAAVPAALAHRGAREAGAGARSRRRAEPFDRLGANGHGQLRAVRRRRALSRGQGRSVRPERSEAEASESAARQPWFAPGAVGHGGLAPRSPVGAVCLRNAATPR